MIAGRADGRADVAVLAGDGRAAGGEHPGLARLQQAVVVGIADVVAAGEDRRRVDARDAVGDGDAGKRHVAGGADVVGPGDGAADGQYRPGALLLSVPLVSLTMLMFVV